MRKTEAQRGNVTMPSHTALKILSRNTHPGLPTSRLPLTPGPLLPSHTRLSTRLCPACEHRIMLYLTHHSHQSHNWSINSLWELSLHTLLQCTWLSSLAEFTTTNTINNSELFPSPLMGPFQDPSHTHMEPGGTPMGAREPPNPLLFAPSYLQLPPLTSPGSWPQPPCRLCWLELFWFAFFFELKRKRGQAEPCNMQRTERWPWLIHNSSSGIRQEGSLLNKRDSRGSQTSPESSPKIGWKKL